MCKCVLLVRIVSLNRGLQHINTNELYFCNQREMTAVLHEEIEEVEVRD